MTKMNLDTPIQSIKEYCDKRCSSTRIPPSLSHEGCVDGNNDGNDVTDDTKNVDMNYLVENSITMEFVVDDIVLEPIANKLVIDLFVDNFIVEPIAKEVSMPHVNKKGNVEVEKLVEEVVAKEIQSIVLHAEAPKGKTP